ncbi:DeoR/GlpR family DNA-binding transcription regulator [Actinoplanes sp. NPDC026619]|uniref:DeoR/GlpR family DNA-binding transcription regulator n=1 Tax=Actinoplanes sp. NPDC026619 TaxID=3155798 RepID=UPI00341079F4
MASSSAEKVATSGYNRRYELLQRLRTDGRLDVSAIAEEVGISRETLRRDLRKLESQGLLRRSYGVAYPVESGAFESELSARVESNVEEKLRIATTAIAHLGGAQNVFIDEGFTTQLIAQHLPQDEQITVITPSLPIASLLAPRPHTQVIMLGGRVRGKTLGVVDTWATELLGRLTIDLALIGANGVSMDRGLTTPDPAVAVVKSAAIRSAIRRIFIGTHSKFGRATFVRFAEATDFELMITGRELAPAMARTFTNADIRLLRV